MLKVWIPGTQDLSDQGLGGLTWTNTGVVINNNGKLGKCMYFNGNVNMYKNNFSLSRQFSICCWAKAASVHSGYMFQVGDAPNAPQVQIGLRTDSSAANKWLVVCNKSSGTITVADADYRNWNHYAVTYNGTICKIYVNGICAYTGDFTQTYYGARCSLGCYYSSMYFTGYINDFRIYDDEIISDKQIKELSRGLILHYPLSGPIEHQVFGDAVEDKETYLIRRTPGYNLISKLVIGGRTTLNGSTITLLLSQNADTYFMIQSSEPLLSGQKYTLSMNCSGFPSSDNFIDFGITGQSTGKNIRLHNGYCSATFSPNTNIAANTNFVVDDINRVYSGYQDVTVTNIKLEKGEVETPWIEKNSEFDQIVGGSICWNQWGRFTSTWIPSNNNGITYAYTDGTSVKINGTATAVESRSGWFGVAEGGATKNAPGHVFLLNTKLISGTITSGSLKFSLFNSAQKDVGSSIINRLSTATPTANASFRIIHNITNGTVLTNAIVTLNCFDLTLMFGPAIADYILSLENTTAGNGVAWFRNYFPKDYYPYCAPTMKSVTGLISHNTVGFNTWDESEEGVIIGSYRIFDFPTGLLGKCYMTLKDKNPSATLPSNVAMGFVRDNYKSGESLEINEFRWVLYNGVIRPNHSNTGGGTSTSDGNNLLGAIFIYPNNASVFEAIKSKYDICINISDPAKNGTYEPYVGRSYALDSNVVLRGTWKLNDNNKLYCDGDVYSGDGTVTRKYAVVDLSTLSWTYYTNIPYFQAQLPYAPKGNSNNGYDKNNEICNKFITVTWRELYTHTAPDKSLAHNPNSSYLNVYDSLYTDATTFKTSLTGVYYVYELATPTTEITTPFSNPQVCSIEGTEEYVIAEQDGVVIPAGHQTKYLHDVLEGRYHTYEEAVSGMGINDNIEYDVSGYKRNGTKTGALKYDENTPKYTYSTKFDGVNAIKLPNFVYTSGVWTVSIWYYYSILPSAYQAILYFGKGDGSDNNKKISISPNSTYIWFKTENNNFSVSNITKDRWVNITLTSDGTTGKIYIDGVYSKSLSITSVLTDCTDLVVGARASASGCATIAIPMNNGMLSDFRFYSTCFSADDVYELYNAGVAT